MAWFRNPFGQAGLAAVVLMLAGVIPWGGTETIWIVASAILFIFFIANGIFLVTTERPWIYVGFSLGFLFALVAWAGLVGSLHVESWHPPGTSQEASMALLVAMFHPPVLVMAGVVRAALGSIKPKDRVD